MGMRPDYATIVYCNLIKQTYKDVPIIIGGIESSLRRLAHYDYWSDKVKHSILIDSGADLLLYGMGEKSVVEVADALDSGMDVSDITYVKGTVYKAKILTVCMIILNCRIMMRFHQIRFHMQKALKSSMKIQTHLQQKHLLRNTKINAS